MPAHSRLRLAQAGRGCGTEPRHPDPALRALLPGTGKKRLIEGSPYDSYRGIGPSGKGKNRPGVLLMVLRDALAAGA